MRDTSSVIILGMLPGLIPSLRRDILIVVVLYRLASSESQSLKALIEIFQAHPEFAQYFSLIIYDNSPQRNSPEFKINIPFLYKHDPANSGLAAAYNFALGHAEETQHEWLLLLDQDTLPTQEFIAELIECTLSLRTQDEVASIVPKLLVHGTIYSPAAHFIDQLRYQYRRSNHAVSRDVVGVQQERTGAYNSGATLRVPALRYIGGFPTEYWLDYLDHAVFHTLSANRYYMYVMQAEIGHEASQSAVATVSAVRQHNLLSAQALFVKQTGNFIDRILYRIWLLRYCRILWLRHPDRSLWRRAAIQALLLKTQEKGTPYDKLGENDP